MEKFLLAEQKQGKKVKEKAMKKAVLIVLSMIALTACRTRTDQDIISEDLGVDVSSAEVISDMDTHGGFHGDGTAVIILDCADTGIPEQISTAGNWKPFPLDDTVRTLVYGTGDKNVKIGPYLIDEDGEPLLPEIKDGYYLLIDRQTEDGKATGPDILHRASFNFTLGLYDAAAEKLYLCKMDT